MSALINSLNLTLILSPQISRRIKKRASAKLRLRQIKQAAKEIFARAGHFVWNTSQRSNDVQ